MIIKFSELNKLIGQKTVYAGGVFDLTHYGHVYYINRIKATYPNHKLVIGIVPDKRVTVKKGPKRPIFTQRERAEIMNSFKAVDYVCIEPVKKSGQKSATLGFIKALEPEFAIFVDKAFLSLQRDLGKTTLLIFPLHRPDYYSTSALIKGIIEKHSK
jgi:cytidyltransferase-like protein